MLFLTSIAFPVPGSWGCVLDPPPRALSVREYPGAVATCLLPRSQRAGGRKSGSSSRAGGCKAVGGRGGAGRSGWAEPTVCWGAAGGTAPLSSAGLPDIRTSLVHTASAITWGRGHHPRAFRQSTAAAGALQAPKQYPPPTGEIGLNMPFPGLIRWHLMNLCISPACGSVHPL